MTTKFVSTTGNNSNPGTQVSPYLTWQKGLENIGPRDKLFIRGGTYAQKVNSSSQTVPSGSSFADAPIISGFEDEPVILAPPNDSGLKLNQDLFQVWKKFTIDCASCADDGIDVGGNSTRSIRFQNLEVKNMNASGFNGILAWGDKNVCGYHQFIDCHIHHCNQSFFNGHGLYINVPNCLIDGLTIHDNGKAGVHVFANASFPDEGTSNTIVRRVLAYNHPAFSAIQFSGGSNMQCYNCIVFNNIDGIGVEFGTSGSNNLIYNNTVYGNSNYGIRIGGNQTNAQIKNCIAYLNGTNISDAGSGTIQSNNLTTNPLFVDPAHGDFRLQPGSPAIDAGVDLSAYLLTDFYGHFRG